MKTFTALLLIITALSGYSQNGQPQTESSNKVVSIHEFEINDDTDPMEFEKFVLTEIAPVYNRMKGQKFELYKGNRGIRLNKYVIILTFDSINDRNRIFPEEGGTTEDWGSDTLWQKLNSMTNGLWKHHTDYNKITINKSGNSK